MGQFHSIRVSGMALFDRPIEATIGGIEVDLASAPLDPGNHELRVGTAVGGIEIYIPNYVKLVVEGGAVIGGYDIHEGLGIFERMGRRLAKLFNLSNQIPAEAVPAPAAPVSIKLIIDGGIGGIDIYRLPVRASA